MYKKKRIGTELRCESKVFKGINAGNIIVNKSNHILGNLPNEKLNNSFFGNGKNLNAKITTIEIEM